MPWLTRWRAYVVACLLLAANAVLAPVVQAGPEPLTMGVFPRRNFSETAKLFTPMSDHLGERLGRKVVLVTSRNFSTFWKEVSEARYDIVHYNQYHYIRSAHAYEVIAHIEEFGRSTIVPTVYVRRDSGITDLTQLKDRSVMFGGGEDAMVSYVAIRHLFQQAGLKKKDINALFAVNPPNAILALDRRQAAAASVGDTILELPEVRAAVDVNGLTPLASAPPLLQLPVAVRRDMPPRLRAEIQSILVDLEMSEAGRQVLRSATLTGMGKAEDRDYDPHRRIAAAVLGDTFAAAPSARRGEPGSPGR